VNASNQPKADLNLTMKNQETQMLNTLRDEVVLPITSRKTILMDETKIMKLRSDQIVIDQEIREVQKRIFSRKNAENDKSLFINRKRPSSQLHT